MSDINVKIRFKKEDDEGTIKIAQNREGIYVIYVDRRLSKIKQVNILIHELTHMISDIFYGLLDLNISEEALCERLSSVYTKELEKFLRKWK